MERIANAVKKILIGIIFWVGLIFFFLLMANKVFAATIDPSGIGQHEYTEILKQADDEDIEMLERVVYHEAGKCTDWRVRLAVIETVLNRCLADGWPDKISKVCKQKNQFACRAIPKSATEEELEGVADAIEHIVHSGRTVLPDTDYVYFAIGRQKEAKDHIQVGDGKRKWQSMWFGRSR